jgi:hypothetical protein
MVPDLRMFMIPDLRSSWFQIFAGSWFLIFTYFNLPEIDCRFTRRSQIWLIFSHITQKLISWTSTKPTFRGCNVSPKFPNTPKSN